MAEFAYVGSELDLFAAAVHWKRYVRRVIAPFLGAEVLEVGAGFGGTTKVLCQGGERRWVCLEPDPTLVARLDSDIREGRLPEACRALVGTTDTLGVDESFDSILYMDVLEHMEDDRAEMTRAASLLRPGGHLVVLSPAHQWLFSPFDQAIGHYRRYSKRTLSELHPEGLELVQARYLDAFGMLASLGNRLLLRSPLPTAGQIALWDKVLVPLSSSFDRLLGYSVGKSVVCVWRRAS
jgi:2-polyprenyl-3-methyl-5-hydroxy-6-metoxy-1,4-benzoquinol methylase